MLSSARQNFSEAAPGGRGPVNETSAVAICIVTYDSALDLPGCMASVAALTHPSAKGQDGAGPNSYERLEFLGDRVLGLIVADLLLERLPATLKHADGQQGMLGRIAHALGVD